LRRGLRLRLALTHALVAALAIAVVAVVVNVAGERRFQSYLDDVRERSDAAVVQILEQTYTAGVGWDAQAIFALSQAAHLNNVNLAVYSPEGQLQFTVQGMHRRGQGMMGGGMMGGQGALPEAEDAAAATPSPLDASSFDIRGYPVAVDGEAVATVEIYAARDQRVAAESAYEDALMRYLLFAAVLAAALALFISVFVSRRITGPLEELTDAAENVAAGNLDVRVAPRGDDEVASLAAAFNTMADALARDEQWRRDMTADLSHELRTPLATIQSRIEALEDEVMPATPENLRVIGDEVERLGRLLGALRSLNELESEDFEVEFGSLDLGEVAADALTRVEPEAGRRKVTLERQLEPAAVRGDRDRLLQVVANLLDNALKFTGEGGTVTVTVRAEGTDAVLSVADTGPGIEAVDLPFVFDRFYRSQSARSTQGVGLGLAIAKGLVESHGGTVEAANGTNGAVFTVRLPRAR
jgi:two-component system sensor histidine kinase BaeS